MALFYPNTIVDLLRERPVIYKKEIQGLWREVQTMFPHLKQESIMWKSDGIILGTEMSLKFPGNAWKQRLDVKAPNVDGLYFVGDTVRMWSTAMDGSVCSAILAAERILKTKVL